MLDTANFFKLTAKPFAPNAANDQSLLGIAQEFSRPIDRATVNQLHELTGWANGMDMKTEIAIVASAFCSLIVEYTFHLYEPRVNYRKKILLNSICLRI
jgi:hypothetical protein